MTIGRQRLAAVLLFAATVALGWVAYAPALGGAFLLDDIANLDGLRLVDDSLSALKFVFSGEAGPLGRPLALATFVPQAAAWGETAEPFIRINILIHLLNACVLAWVLYRLSVASRIRENNALTVATAAAAVWMFMPLLASSSLMIVQRMTTVSAFFVLLGLAGYLQARQSIERRPARALIGMSISLIAGTLLAAFAKENGALLPTLVLVTEATLLSRPASINVSRWRIWHSIFLGLPTAMILAYLAWRVPYSEELILRREFTAWERLLTESRILWEYLFNAFVPQPGQFGPFHDGYPIARTILDPITAIAFLGWLATLAAALVWRRRYPLVAFAVLWFLSGHLLESTVIPLELYFEHRNYLPVIGPVFALCALGVTVGEQRKRLVYAGVSLYALVSALVLFSLTSLWGNPATAARYWHEQFPDSARAATTAASYQLATERPQRTVQILHGLVEKNPDVGYVKIQELNLSCIIAPSGDHQSTVTELNGLLSQVDFSYTAGTMLSQLFTTASRVECNEVGIDTVRMLARTLVDNPRYRNNDRYNRLHHQLMARTSRYEGKFDQALRHLEKANEYYPSSELNMMMVTTLVDAEDFDAARAYIEKARQSEPWRPVKALLWSRDLDNLQDYIDKVEAFVERRSDSVRQEKNQLGIDEGTN